MNKVMKPAAIALAASTMAVATPASAEIFEYTLSNGHVLTINTDTQTGSYRGDQVNAAFESPDFANFEGGERPSFMATLTSITGTRILNGETVNVSSDPRHPEMLKTKNDGTRWNLWANWGDPIVAGDFVSKTVSYAEVPAPGMLGLFGLALIALGFGRRRRSKVTAA